jgi:hypothetical protein
MVDETLFFQNILRKSIVKFIKGIATIQKMPLRTVY